MRTAFAYTTARILMFGVSVMLLYFAGARGILLLGLALVISAIASYILLNKQRQIMAARLNRRLSRVGEKAAEFRERLEEGAAAEDEPGDQDEPAVPAGETGPAGETTPAAGTTSAAETVQDAEEDEPVR
jgi:Protein of unknown function (DUF4229)